MKLTGMWVAIGAVGLVLQVQAADPSRGELIVEGSDAMSLGKFTVEDVTIKVKQSFANPRAMAEYRFGGTPFAIGGEYSKMKNDYDGTYEFSDGSFTMDRTDWGVFVRFGYRDSINLRLGYRNFQYDITDAIINQRDEGGLVERDVNGTAKAEMSKGADAELNLVFGDQVQFALSLGGSYFKDAEYTWSYDVVGGGRVVGAAKVDAYSARIRPELAFKVSENARIFVNYTVSATMWKGREITNTTTDYPAYDLISAAGVGLRLNF